MIPVIPSKYWLIGLGVVLVLGTAFSYGYHKGSDAQEKATAQKLLKASERLLEAEQRLARLASRKASEDAQRITQAVTEGVDLRKEYNDAPKHPVDSVNCVSPEQRRLLVEAAGRTAQPPL